LVFLVFYAECIIIIIILLVVLYGCETLSLALKEEHRLRILQIGF
jgi:hypothetical protein